MKKGKDKVIGLKHGTLPWVNYCPSRKYQPLPYGRRAGKVSRGLNLKMLKEIKETWDAVRFGSFRLM